MPEEAMPEAPPLEEAPPEEASPQPFKGTKSLKVTFQRSLPMGTRGTFTHEKELWIAYPAEKNSELHAITTRLIGVLAAIQIDLIGMLNDNPDDAVRTMAIVARINRIEELVAEAKIDLAEKSTS